MRKMKRDSWSTGVDGRTRCGGTSAFPCLSRGQLHSPLGVPAKQPHRSPTFRDRFLALCECRNLTFQCILRSLEMEERMISDTDMDVLHVLKLRKPGELQINCSLKFMRRRDGAKPHESVEESNDINSVSYAGDLQLPQSWRLGSTEHCRSRESNLVRFTTFSFRKAGYWKLPQRHQDTKTAPLPNAIPI